MKQTQEELCSAAALSCLSSICANDAAKDADRIAAAKLLLEYGAKGGTKEESTLRVVLDGVPEGYFT
ncbi:MAG TPA: hypothetical protein PKB13_13170 [Clostridia bacterium]|nr:hypothetical protein [Clostridia bacterium]